MARPLRIEFPGAIYHVTSRGDRREPIFEDDEDRLNFLAVIEQAMQRFDAVALAYCLMDNHYHFVIHTRQANLSRLMRQVNGVYTQTYNRCHGKTGHLFQGRFKAILVDQDAYLLEVCRYVDLNPVRARMVRLPGKWPWSSYLAHTAHQEGPDWLDTPAVHAYLLGRAVRSPADRSRAAMRYATLVAEGRDTTLWDDALVGQIYLGDAAFVARMQALAEPVRASSREVPRAQLRMVKRSIKQFMEDHESRDDAIVAAYREGQHTLTDIANTLGLSISRISRIVRRSEQAALEAKGKT